MTTQTNLDALLDSCNRNPEWEGNPPSINPVPGGLTNHNFRLSISGVGPEIFAKIPGPGTEAFIDRSVANAAARQAAEAGISPQVMFDMVDEHLDQVRGSAIALPSWADDVIHAYGRAAERFRASGLDIVPAHNDPMPGNFLIGDDGSVKLIDFDYAANNDVAYELALIFAEMFVSEEDARALVTRYRGHDDERFFARVMVCRMIADTKWGLWGLINNAVRDEEFDYYKYGTWKLYRTFLISRHPRFEEWLELI